MKRFKKKTYLLMALLLLMSSILAACSQDNGSTEWTTDSVDDLKAQIEALQEENASLKAQLEQYTGTEQETTTEQPAETQPASEALQETESQQTEETQVAEEPAEDRLNIVVFGDSIWDMDRTETGIAAQVASFMDADVYNCAIGGTRATLKEGESPDKFDTWDSTSLMGMVNVIAGKVDPEFMEGYPAGGVIRNVDPSKVDYYILAYGLNDYFAGAPIAVEGGNNWDAHGYAGALRNAVLLLRQTSPNAQILLISPTYCQFYKDGYMYTDSNMKDYGNGTLTDYVNAAQNVAETEQTLYIDAYSTMGINIYTAEEYLEDGIHLTEAGRTLYAKAVSSCLKYGKPGEVSGNSVYY